MRLAPHLLLLALPLVASAWLTRKALVSQVSDPAVRWFRFMRSFNLVVLGTWLSWIAALWLSDGGAVLAAALGVSRSGQAVWLTVVLYFVPPGLVHALCTQIAYPVLSGVRGMEVTRGELLAQALWTQAAIVLPLVAAVGGLDAFRAGEERLAVGLWGAAGAAFLLASRRRMRALRMEPNALTEGELRDRVFALADQAGVRLKQIYVLQALRARLANALAAVGNVVMLTDYLLQNLSRREVDAVVAHELAHLKRRHPLLLLGVATVCIMVPMIWGGGSHSAALPLAPLGAILAVLLVSRRFERGADALAARLTGDGEALITALAKLATLNLLPLHWGRLDEALLTHPSVRRRALAVARSCGIAAARVEELLQARDPGGDRYPVPRVVLASGALFDTTFKSEVAVVNTWALILAMTATPALAAFVAGRAPGPWWAWCAAGVALTVLACLALTNVMPPLGQRRLGRRLAARFTRDGLGGVVERGDLVGFAPTPEPRLYEGNLSWDMGFLVVAGDRLGFAGERVRLALDRAEVTGVCLGPTYPAWWRTAGVVVKWRASDGAASGAFQVRPADVGSLSQLRRRAVALEERLGRWWRGADEGPGLPELAALGPPALGEVTSQTPRGAVSGVGCLVLAVVVEGIAAGLAVSLRLGPWAALYALAVPALTAVALFLPVLTHRRAAAGPAPSGQTEGPPSKGGPEGAVESRLS